MGETLFGLRWRPKLQLKKIGEKSVNVTAFGSERSRISLILSICEIEENSHL